MAFHIYPDPATATLLGTAPHAPLLLPAGGNMARFVPLERLVELDAGTGARGITLIRVAFSGAAIVGTHPKIQLLAHDPELGDDAPLIDPASNVNADTAVPLFDLVHTASAARAHFVPPFVDNVYLLRVRIERSDTHLWMRIGNTTRVARNVTWVVGTSDADSRQPWVHAAPPTIAFDALVGESPAPQPISLVNFGTGAATVAGLSPSPPPAYVVNGLPAILKPNTSAQPTIALATTAAPLIAPPSSHQLSTRDASDPGPFGAGHNQTLELRARVQRPAPAFARAGQQVRPARARPGAEITLFGSNFDQPPVAVDFGGHTVVRDVLSNSTSAVLRVPELPSGTSVALTIVTAGGHATSADTFTVSFPIIDHVDPTEGGPETIVTIEGRELIVEGQEVFVTISPSETQPDTPAVGGQMTIIGTPTPTRIVAQTPVERRQAFEVDCLIEVSRSDGAFARFEDGFFYFDKGL
jgi:hypothetical protein